MEPIAEDMQRYAIRHDALKRALTSAEERNACLQALQMLVGHKAVNAVHQLLFALGPVDDVRQLPGILIQLELQVAILVYF